jgi:hypothetical protein
MKQIFLLSMVTWLISAAAFADDKPPSIIFNLRSFVDTEGLGFIHVEGTLTGEGLAYKENRSAISCYRDRKECIGTHFDAEGMQVFSLHSPEFYTIRAWTPNRVTADTTTACGGLETWIIDRTKQTAELTTRPCSEEMTYHWTIEEPPFWRDEKTPKK